MDGKLSVVGRLAQLYLENNQFDRLLERLQLEEIWSPARAGLKTQEMPASQILLTLAAESGNHIHIGDPYGSYGGVNGPWTVEKLAFHGQGRDDMLPAGDLAYVKLVGRMLRMGRRATVEEVREFFAPYAPFEALAGLYLLFGRRFVMPAGRPV